MIESSSEHVDLNRQSNLLDQIYDLGEKMYGALSEEDLDHFFELTAERGTLLDSLSQYNKPADIDPRWEGKAKALTDQFERLSTAFAGQEQKMGHALETMGRFKMARSQYNQRPTGNCILNRNLRG